MINNKKIRRKHEQGCQGTRKEKEQKGVGACTASGAPEGKGSDPANHP